MSAERISDKVRQFGPRKLVAIAALAFLALWISNALRPKQAEAAGSYFNVRKGDFMISVVEGGTLQAVNEVVIRNEIEGTARIIYIVPEGTYVKKGDLLVELDSAQAQDQVNNQLINVEKAQFALVQAEEQLAIQRSVVESEVRAAELKLTFATMDLDKFAKGEERQERRKAEADIASMREKLEIDREKAEWSVKLAEQGFETKANRDRDNLTLLQTKISLEMATNQFAMLETFDLPKKRATYESAVREAEAELQRVKHQGNRKIAQYEADVRTQKITLDLSKSKLERDQKNLAAAKIIAPQDGLVVYSVSDNRFSSESLVEEGATVRNRQTLIKLPDISEMKLSIKIHESHINMITPGQPAFIVLDSMPDQRFRGYVSKVGLLPDTQSRWGNPNLKVYATEILVTDSLPDVKPGVSARAEVIVTNLQNVISVPLQAVTTRQGKPVVYLADGGESKAVDVQVGLYNTKFIEITSGLKEGDRILLAPPLDTHQKDLSGAIVAEGEEVQLTNNPAIGARTEGRSANGSDAAPQRNGEARPNRDQQGRGSGANGRWNDGPSEPGAAPASGEPRENRRRDSADPAQGPSAERGPRPEGPGASVPGGQRPNFDELRKQFDKDGDGELNDEERAAMRAQFGGGQRGARPRRPQAEGEAAAPSSQGERPERPRQNTPPSSE